MRASLYCVSEDRALRTAAGTVARRRDAQLRVFAAPEPFFAHVASEADSKRAACLVTEGDTLAAREAAFASRLRQAAGGMPVVIVSGMADLRTVLATLGPGGWSVLASDAGVDALDEAVGRALAFDRWQRDRIGAAERHARATRLGDALRQASTVELTVQLIHELSQPLTAINAWAGACRASVAAAGEAAAALAEPVGLMVQESQRATDILRAFRALARRPEPDLATCDVNAALGGIAALLETEVRAEAIDLRLVLARNLSPARADPTLVELAAYVLCRNAVDTLAARPGGRREIVVRSRVVGNEVVVSVADSGPGLDEAVRNQLFKPLANARTNRLGIGLAVCRTAIESLGGRLWLDANAADGASFAFALPVAQG